MQSRMGEGEEFGFDVLVVVEEQIEIDRPRLFERLIFSAQQVLDPEHPGHHLRGRDALADVSRRNAVVLKTVEIRKPVAIDPPAEGDDVSATARETYSAIAAAMSAALGDMSEEMAALIRRDVTSR
jgi:hypothetical protein